MGSPLEPSLRADLSSETLARVVLRCRELAGFLEEALPHLPARSDSPFLHGQLDDVPTRRCFAPSVRNCPRRPRLRSTGCTTTPT